MTGFAAGSDQRVVEIAVPADPGFVSLLRTVAASLAASRDFTIDEIDDLRLAVDEASALLLPHAGPGARLAAVFSGGDASLRVEVSLVAAGLPQLAAIDQQSFAWMVLAALADTVAISSAGDRLVVSLTKSRGARLP